jgi:hypothetical protein
MDRINQLNAGAFVLRTKPRKENKFIKIDIIRDEEGDSLCLRTSREEVKAVKTNTDKIDGDEIQTIIFSFIRNIEDITIAGFKNMEFINKK